MVPKLSRYAPVGTGFVSEGEGYRQLMTSSEQPNENVEIVTTPATPGAQALPTSAPDPDAGDDAAAE